MCVITIPLWLIIVIVIVVVSRSKESNRNWVLDLAKMKGHRCELTMKTGDGLLRYGVNGQYLLVDADEEWVLVSRETPNGEVKRLVRISEIESMQVID